MRIDNNYHTHTFRCGHAIGTDEEYVLKAIEAGIKELGFSDHVPFKNHPQPGVRMNYDKIDDYINSISYLRDKYKDKIDIKIGFEAEYYSEIKDYYEELLTKVDYLICGQHFAINKDGDIIYVGHKRDNKEVLVDYTNRVIEAIESGLFKYIAHPDLILNCYTMRDDFLEKEMRRICVAAEKNHIPLEINCEGLKRQVSLGIIGKESFYPYDYFWNIVKDYDVDVILGGDIHDPNDFLNDQDKYGYDIIKRFNLHHIQKINIK